LTASPESFVSDSHTTADRALPYVR
jgi:hypothetical protein